MSRASWIALLVVLAWPVVARAGDPDRVWKTIETDHFVINYYEPLGEVARKVALSAERAHKTLAAALDVHPEEKTQLTVVDDTDGANGFAGVLPRNAIRLFANAPRGVGALSDHDDWLYSLVAHEYTHILHLDAISGLPRLYNRIFGKVWSPNQIQPRWLIEGLATYEESKRSAGGRTRHALFDAELRMATLRGDERGLDEISNGPRAYPHANAAYLYGSHFLKYVFDRYGDDKAREMTWDYGRNPIPWGLNQTMQRVIGRTYVQLYGEWRDYRRSKYAMQKEAVERQGRREGRRLTFSGESNTAAKYTKDGKHIVWRRADGVSRGGFYWMPADGTSAEAVPRLMLEREGVYDLFSDGRMLVEQTRTRGETDTQDLHVYETEDRFVRLTEGARSNDPSLSPDESMIAFTASSGSRRVLRVMPVQPEADSRIVWEGSGRWDQAFAPKWSPDGKRIAFGAWRTGGYKDILILDLATGQVEEVQHDRAQDADPLFTTDGKYLLFTSDRSGIFNLYAYELSTRKLSQVTNVLGAAYEASISPDGTRVLYTGFDAGHQMAGDEIYELELRPSTWIPAPLYVDDRPDPTEILDTEVEISKPRDYRPLETLAPRTYTLGLSSNAFGNVLEISTDGADMVGRHSYQIAAGVGLTDGDLSLGGSYAFNYFWPTLRIGANRSANQRGGYRIDGLNTRFVEEAISLTAGVSLPVIRDPGVNSSLSFDYDFDHLRNVKDSFEGYDPSEAVPVYPETDVTLSGLALRWNWSNSRGTTHTLGPQEGQQIALGARLDHPSIGSDFHSLSLDYRWTWWHKLPWGVTPVLAARLAGGLRTTDRGRSSVFSLGGAPQQELVDALVNSLRAGSTGFLRGYEARAFSGRQFHLLNLEYRQELFNIERGFATLPLYLRRVHAAGLFDAGDAFDGKLDLSTFKTSVGAALRMDYVLGYFATGSLDVGYSRGLNEEGINEYWVLLTGAL